MNSQPSPGKSLACALVSTIYLTAAAILIWFGVHDLFEDPGYGARIVGVAMLVAGIALGVSAAASVVAFTKGSSSAASVALFGAILGFVAASSLLVYQLVNGDYTPWVWVWIALCVGTGWAAIRMYHGGARLKYPKTFAVATTVATVVAVLNFGYSNIFLPSSQHAKIDLDVELSKALFSSDHTIADIPMAIKITNSGTSRIVVLSSLFSVVGIQKQVSPTKLSRIDNNVAIEAGEPEAAQTKVTGYERIEDGEFFPPGWGLAPTGTGTVNRVIRVHLPIDFQSISAYAEITTLDQDAAYPQSYVAQPTYSWDMSSRQHVTDAPAWIAPAGVDFSRYDIPLREASYLNSQIRDTWHVVIWHVYAEPRELDPNGAFSNLVCTVVNPDSISSYAEATPSDTICSTRYDFRESTTDVSEHSVYELGFST